ncbi:hypothetical protein WG68_16345 [Arsukibacterium ikkense]|uniref:Uncharacterized protein n=1 Tax=Arsukibacterium ikkense TaxID=336831 RepID=A0A0M2V3J8_9GAMM|nr:hypothetical protein [Arsukibacterium ikkense]KKO44210.1 hypothetical protein WG68_16345 [Arsukibacterium ikkense]
MKRDSKVFLAVAVILSIINLIDFIFYGQKIGYLALAIGFSLMAFGTYRDNNIASLFGAVIVICGFTAKWFLDYDLF